MHGPMLDNPFMVEEYNKVARAHVDGGDLKTVRDGAMFWAFDTDPVRQADLNFPLLEYFRDRAAARGQTMQSIRDLPKYFQFRPGIGVRSSCDIYSSGFARGISGDTVTVAVDNASPNDYFRLSEVGVLLDNPDLKKVRRLSRDDSGSGLVETMYDSVPAWLLAQQKQWFKASFVRAQRDAWKDLGSPVNEDLLKEMKALRACLNGPGRRHEATDAIRAQNEAQFTNTVQWIEGLSRRSAVFHSLQSVLTPSAR